MPWCSGRWMEYRGGQCTALHERDAGIACAAYLVGEVDHLLNNEVEVLAAPKRALRDTKTNTGNV